MEKRLPKPYEVRTMFKQYLMMLNKFNGKPESEFNKCGHGSYAYYVRSIAHYKQYLEKHGHLLTVYLKPKIN